MGVQEMTRFGMKERDFELLANYIGDVIAYEGNVKQEIINLRSRFLVMQYCMPSEKAAPLAARILASAMPNADYAKKFAENMMKLAK